MSQLFASGSQSIGASASASVLPNYIQSWFPLRLTRFDLIAVQGTLKSLLQHHSSKASILWHLAFFMVQFSHPCVTTGETIALTIWTFVSKVMCLLFNTPSMFVITFLPRRKQLLISWLQSLSAVILEPKKIKSATVSIFSWIQTPRIDLDRAATKLFSINHFLGLVRNSSLLHDFRVQILSPCFKTSKFWTPMMVPRASLVTQLVKNSSAMWEP